MQNALTAVLIEKKLAALEQYHLSINKARNNTQVSIFFSFSRRCFCEFERASS